MCSTIGAVLSSLEIQRAAIFAPHFDDLPKNLRVGRSWIGFPFEPAHRSYHHQHDPDQHNEERDPDSEEIRRIQNDHQD